MSKGHCMLGYKMATLNKLSALLCTVYKCKMHYIPPYNVILESEFISWNDYDLGKSVQKMSASESDSIS